MSPDRWKEISQIFNEVLEKESDQERRELISAVCADDIQLGRDIELLLAAHESKDDFIESMGIAGSKEWTPIDLESGQSIGVFSIERLLGKGGMGEVYLARDTVLDRHVAIKVLPPEMAGEDQANKRLLREAKAAAALEHPHICTIHEIGHSEKFNYIVMQYAEGETLSEVIEKGPLEINRALRIAEQVALAIGDAHDHGIIHRDIKPSNIVLTSGDQVKVLDFGLAKKLVSTKPVSTESSIESFLSQPGMILGTVSYMSPEQARGNEVDGRTDLWSLGVVLYEMAIGRKPFEGDALIDKLVAIFHEKPEYPEGFPQGLREFIDSLLTKDRNKRCPSAGEAIECLKGLRKELEFEKRLAQHVSSDSGSVLDASFLSSAQTRSDEHVRSTISKKTGVLSRFSPINILLAGLVLGLIAIGGLYWRYVSNISWAKENISNLAKLAAEEQYFEAYDLADEIRGYLPNEPEVIRLMPTISDRISVGSKPAEGAKVYLRKFAPDQNGKFPDRELIGVTPLKDVEIARGHYLVAVEKEGFEVFERTISGTIPRIGGSFIDSPPIDIVAHLVDSSSAPGSMVYVPGSKYQLVNWSRPTQSEVDLEGFFVDKYEVSNQEFKEFITSGGYQTRKFWNHPFMKDGKELPLVEAVELFKDKTGLPGPRSWSNQNFPAGKENFPVTDITWYEAAAYAEFRGKQLPTVFQWEKAARNGVADVRFNAMPWGLIKQGETTDFRSNFGSSGPVEVASYEFGMSPFGAYNMAGNVSEWILNRSGDNFVTSGGSWNDLPYTFGGYGEYPGFFASDKLGFRCVLNSKGVKTNQGSEDLIPSKIPEYKPSNDSDVEDLIVHYQYDRRAGKAKIVKSVKTDAWVRETVEFFGEKNEKITAHLYLPNNYSRPLQVIHYIPPGDVVRGLRSLTDSVEMFLTPIIKSGRAVFAVELKGYKLRPLPPKYLAPDPTTVEFRKEAVNKITELRLGLDYLEQRKEIDLENLSLLGISNGGNLSTIILAVEKRYKTAILVGAGVDESWAGWIPEANYIKLASYSGISKLMINGRYDETHPFKTFGEPLFKLLKRPKELVVYEGGHIPDIPFFARTAGSWLDKELEKPTKF